jgi:hypothetical protein
MWQHEMIASLRDCKESGYWSNFKWVIQNKNSSKYKSAIIENKKRENDKIIQKCNLYLKYEAMLSREVKRLILLDEKNGGIANEEWIQKNISKISLKEHQTRDNYFALEIERIKNINYDIEYQNHIQFAEKVNEELDCCLNKIPDTHCFYLGDIENICNLFIPLKDRPYHYTKDFCGRKIKKYYHCSDALINLSRKTDLTKINLPYSNLCIEYITNIFKNKPTRKCALITKEQDKIRLFGGHATPYFSKSSQQQMEYWQLMECEIDDASEEQGIMFLLLELLDYKNIYQEIICPCKKTNRIRKSKGKLPIYSYHVLKVKPIGQYRAYMIGKPDDPLSHNRLHFRRGHHKIYTPERPLLGKHNDPRFVGKFWWPSVVAGKNEDGFVDKDYEVKCA